ncbi:sigma-54 interaction domain-containing protein [Nannocystaceae bacterium ST9]
MLVRVGIHVRDVGLRQRVRRALSNERFSSVVVTELEGRASELGGAIESEPADPLERLRSDSNDLLVVDAVPLVGTAVGPARDDEALRSGPTPADARKLVDALAALPERPGLIVLHPTDDPRAHAALLAAGCVAVLWAGLSDVGLAEALSALFERRRNDSLSRLLAARPQRPEPEPMISASAAMQTLLVTVRRVAVADTPVLLLGETGVGKERIAQLLHAWSPRSRGPFVAVNCAAIPAELFESELFGHERGAFTGAARARRGHFELAHGGTLFLDEIGEVPLALQAKLLRVLQDRRIRPLGGDRELVVDVRVVAATNRDLRSDMEAGGFRRDLYYRLGVVELEVPPLRERPQDVRELAERYAAHFAARLGRAVGRIDPDALAALEGYAWPGNVRELVNVIERAVLLSIGSSIVLADLPVAIARPDSSRTREAIDPMVPATSTRDTDPTVQLPHDWLDQPWKQVRERLLIEGERAYLIGLLSASGGRIGASARQAGIAERSLFEKMKRHGLRKEDFRGPRR